jgi:aminoglycoside phosphotransferase (APT) family kinase protein
MKPSLVVLAAGIGSRFGGLKQIEPVDGAGQLIIDYSIYDAMRAGFETVICVITKEIEADFRAMIGDRISRFVDLRYCFQRLDDLPAGRSVPAGRKKPWGTAHALLAARHEVSGPFAVINADDFYGASAYKAMFEFLSNRAKEGLGAMVGYKLGDTLSGNGHVARGICELDERGMLSGITERTHIVPRPGGAAYADGDDLIFVPSETIVSMNLWGFDSSFMKEAEERLSVFLDGLSGTNILTSEYFLPWVSAQLLDEKKIEIEVLERMSSANGTPNAESSQWFGITYRSDLPTVKLALSKLIESGEYPEELWQEKPLSLLEQASRFKLQGAPVHAAMHGSGLINVTSLVEDKTGKRYVMQKINSGVFKKPIAVMKNIVLALDRLKGAGLTLVPSLSGELWDVDPSGQVWRLYDYVPNSVCLQKPRTPNDMKACGKAFGEFLRSLDGIPLELIETTIANFHDAPRYFNHLKEVVKKDTMGRASKVAKELDFALSREEVAIRLSKMRDAGELPVRLVHNDAKLTNVLFDERTGDALCVIDLDTLMPGLAAHDYGEAIRYGANTAAEDEPDSSKAALSLEMAEACTEGFLKACGSMLNRAEAESLRYGAITMTLENGVRFLADYLEGDIYYRIDRESHNLDRCRSQFGLAADMERHWDEMGAMVERYWEKRD